jgi:hypothetical protein
MRSDITGAIAADFLLSSSPPKVIIAQKNVLEKDPSDD